MTTMKPFFLLLSLCALFFVSCRQNQRAEKINVLEKELEAQFDEAKAQELVSLCTEEAKDNPKDHAAAYRYLLLAARYQYLKLDDPAPAAKWINDALAHHAEGQDKSEALGLLAKIWAAYNYKSGPTAKMGPDVIDATRAALLKHNVWIDSALARTAIAMGSPVVTDKAKANDFIDISEGYGQLLRENRQLDRFVEAAGLAKSIDNPNKALQLYYAVADKLPEHPKAPTALFMMAFIYENDLADMDKAKTTYEEFLKKYPKDADFADDAQNALKMLGKSPEEIIRQFEQQQQQSK
jgi:tetratricopeptide (TPR) repeat protein